MSIISICQRNVVVVGSYYVVFATRYKRKLFEGVYGERLEALIREYCGEHDVEIVTLSIYPDHVRMRVCLPYEQGIHRFVALLKRFVAPIFKSEFPEVFKKVPSLWHTSCLVILSEQVPDVIVENYLSALSTSQRSKPLDEGRLFKYL